MSFSWVEPQLATVYERQRQERRTARPRARARVRETGLHTLREDAGRRSGWAETALHGSRTFRLT